MMPYLALLAVPLFAIHLPWTGRARLAFRLGLFCYFIVLLLFVGLRDEIGPDWSGYENIFHIARFEDLTSLNFESEILFYKLNKLSDLLGFGLNGVAFVSTLLFASGIFAYALTTANPWLALAVVTPYLVFVISMSGMRQAAAIGIIFYLFSRWESVSLFRKLALIAFATGFHTSAAVTALYIVLEDRKRLVPKLLLGAPIAFYLLSAASESTTLQRYQSVYLEQNLVSSGAYIHVMLSALPAALYLWKFQALKEQGWTNSLVTLGSFAAILCLPLCVVSSTGADRLSLYLSFVQMWTYPALAATFRAHRGGLLIAASFLTLLIFFGYFSFGSLTDSYIPYRNVLFG